jgi:hypothetical protein
LKVKLDTVSCKEYAGQVKGLRVANLIKKAKDYCGRSAQSQRNFNTQFRLKGCHKECVQEVIRRTGEVVEKLKMSIAVNPCHRSRQIYT